MSDFIQTLTGAQETFVNVYLAVMRFAAPILALILLWRCCKPLLTFRREPEIWAWLCLSNGDKLPITHWENTIGRHKRCDILIDFPTVSRNHAVLTRYDDGSWSITDTHSKDGVTVNGKKVRICALNEGDVISIGGVEMQLQPITHRQEVRLSQLRTRSSGMENVTNLLLLSIFQALTCIGFLMGGNLENATPILFGFGGIMLIQWLLLIFCFIIRRPAFEVETVAFFLCTMGMAAIATVKPGETVKQLVAMVMGIAVFLTVGWSMRDLERAKKMRYVAAVLGIALLGVTLVFGREYYGAKNWLVIGPLSIQPSELSKVCFVYVGASTMDRLLNKRNLISFIAYTLGVCGCLALMNDFGTALIFFCAFLMIAYLRSGSVGTIGLAVTALGFAGVIAVKIAPHALRRFASWRHIWEDPFGAGFQQTRALMCIASGGLFGMGIGKGWLKNVFAADSDIVFATLAEEWGLIMAVLPVLLIVVLALFAMRCSSVSRSSFYTIGACTASTVLLVQTIFNVLGTVDVLPLTGVTFPFVSNGGSSMICAWGLLAFIKAADTRQNASFAVRLGRKGGGGDE
ncbi:MAG: FtsW/RodA/SpoVE family cell cycle protein [Oscillospiraceae bacterium]|nr:FtsW/RodA/SpoVE family cell cycle protein [Oscillospiraceae bacterium]